MPKWGMLVLDVAAFATLAAVAATASRRTAASRGSDGAHESFHPHREARRFVALPLRTWSTILANAWREFLDDNIPLIAAGVTFFSLLALFPAFAAFVSLYGLAADTRDIGEHVRALAPFLPPEARGFVADQLTRLALADHGGLSLAFAAGLATAFWSANGAVSALMVGANIAYGEKEQRSFIRRTLISLALTLGFLLTGMAAVAMVSLGPLLGEMGPRTGVIAGAGGWVLLLLMAGVGIGLIYGYAPSRQPPRWRLVSWGGAAALIGWIGMSALFEVYVANFGHYNKTYGSLGAAVGFMVWMYLSALVVLAGAELNAEIERYLAGVPTSAAAKDHRLRRAKSSAPHD
jgi:membrane protein